MILKEHLWFATTFQTLFKRNRKDQPHTARVYTSQNRVLVILDSQLSDLLYQAGNTHAWLRILEFKTTKKPHIVVATKVQIVSLDPVIKPIATFIEQGALKVWVGSDFKKEFLYGFDGSMLACARYFQFSESDEFMRLVSMQRQAIKVAYQEVATLLNQPWHNFEVIEQNQIISEQKFISEHPEEQRLPRIEVESKDIEDQLPDEEISTIYLDEDGQFHENVPYEDENVVVSSDGEVIFKD